MCYHMKNDGPVYICMECLTPLGLCSDHVKDHSSETGHTSYWTFGDDFLFWNFNGTCFERIESCPEGHTYKLLEYIKYRTYPARQCPPDTLNLPMVHGFYNLGNTCYFNSTLHVLFSIKEFVEYCCTTSCKEKNSLGFEFHRFVSEFVQEKHSVLVNGRLRLALNVEAPQYMKPDPQDSQDYFYYVTDFIRKHLPDSPLTNICDFSITKTTECSSCKKHSTEHSRANILQIEPESESTDSTADDIDDMIQRSLYKHCQEWTCPSCGKTGGVTTTVSISGAPKYLFIHNKLDCGAEEVRFKRPMSLSIDPDNLDISSYTEQNTAYRLIAFTHHKGPWAKYGHDIAYVRQNEKWICFNDEMACFIDDIKKEVKFGEQYVYLFEKLS